MKSFYAVSLMGLLAGTSLVAAPFQWGINGHTVSQEAYFHVPITTQLDLVSELGAGWYRMDWGAKTFQGSTARMDELVAEAGQRQIQLLPVLFASPGGRSKQATPEQIRAAATTYAQAVVSHYKGKITHWELSNELEAHAMIRKGETSRSGKLWKWDGDPDGSSPDHYEETRYQRAKAEILGLQEGVKAADPNARTIVDTAGWLHFGFIERLVREDRVPFDILAWHWYSEMGDLTKVQGKLNLVELLKGFGKPLWITEINRRDGSKGGKEAEQAEYVRKVATQLRATPGIEAVFFYELLDQPYFGKDNPESHYGLVEVVRGSDKKWQVKRKKEAFATAKTGMTD
ncbi:MAG: glycosyl hydrolase [Verrucomicrobiota bacterium]